MLKIQNIFEHYHDTTSGKFHTMKLGFISQNYKDYGTKLPSVCTTEVYSHINEFHV